MARRRGEKPPVGGKIGSRGKIGRPPRAMGGGRRQRVHHGDGNHPGAQRLIGLELTDVDLITAAGMPGRMDHGDGFPGQRREIRLSLQDLSCLQKPPLLLSAKLSK